MVVCVGGLSASPTFGLPVSADLRGFGLLGLVRASGLWGYLRNTFGFPFFSFASVFFFIFLPRFIALFMRESD